MDLNQKFKDFVSSQDLYVPQLSVDCVIFGFHQNQLKVLLVKTAGVDIWALPGGFVEQNEGIDEAALHILKERTGLTDIYLEQFRTFGHVDRGNPAFMKDYLNNIGIEMPDNHWIFRRFISIGYYALVNFSLITPTPGEMTEASEWFDIKQLPQLAFDHNDIMEKALDTLKLMLDTRLNTMDRWAASLLPETFTMIDLQNLFETILETTFHRNNFHRKMVSLELLEKLEKKFTGASNRAPYLYRFKSRIADLT